MDKRAGAAAALAELAGAPAAGGDGFEVEAVFRDLGAEGPGEEVQGGEAAEEAEGGRGDRVREEVLPAGGWRRGEPLVNSERTRPQE